jgi:hypothetical protein
MIASRLGKGKIISMLKLDTIQKEKEENLQLKVQKNRASYTKRKISFYTSSWEPSRQ